MLRPFIRVLFIGLATMFLFSCEVLNAIDEASNNDDDDDNPALTTALDKAAELLSAGVYIEAKNEYDRILREVDPDSRDAKLGWSLARTLELLFEYSNLLIDILLSIDGFVEFMGKTDGRPVDFHSAEVQGIIGEFFDNILHLFEPTLERIDGYLDDIVEDENFEFHIEHLPVIIGLVETSATPIMDIGGEYDRSDILLLSGVVKMLLGFIRWVGAYNLDINVMKMLPPVLLMIDEDNLVNTTGNAIGLVSFIVEYNPKLLALREGGGDKLDEARILIGNGASQMVRAIDSVVLEEDEQLDDIIAIDHNADPPMLVSNFELTNELLSHATYTDGQLFIGILPEIKQAVANLTDNLLSGGARLSWRHDVSPVVSMFLILLDDSGLIGMVNEYIVEKVNTRFADFLLGTTESDMTTEYDVMDYLHWLLPQYLEFDLGAFFMTPEGLHHILPPFYVPPGIDSDPSLIFDARIVAEYDCEISDIFGEDTLIPGFMCPVTGSAMFDSEHFPSPASTYVSIADEHLTALADHNIERIKKDGILNALPYLPLGDASFNNLLWINIDEIDAVGESDDLYDGYSMADNYLFNKLLADISDEVAQVIIDNSLDSIMNPD